MNVHVPKDLTLPPIPPGVYKCSCEMGNWSMGVSSAGNPVCKVKFTILSQGPTDLKTIGRKVPDNFTIIEDSLWRFDMFSRACIGKPLPEGDYEADQLASMVMSKAQGKEFMALIENDTYQGVTRPKIKEFRSMVQ